MKKSALPVRPGDPTFLCFLGSVQSLVPLDPFLRSPPPPPGLDTALTLLLLITACLVLPLARKTSSLSSVAEVSKLVSVVSGAASVGLLSLRSMDFSDFRDHFDTDLRSLAVFGVREAEEATKRWSVAGGEVRTRTWFIFAWTLAESPGARLPSTARAENLWSRVSFIFLSSPLFVTVPPLISTFNGEDQGLAGKRASEAPTQGGVSVQNILDDIATWTKIKGWVIGGQKVG